MEYVSVPEASKIIGIAPSTLKTTIAKIRSGKWKKTNYPMPDKTLINKNGTNKYLYDKQKILEWLQSSEWNKIKKNEYVGVREAARMLRINHMTLWRYGSAKSKYNKNIPLPDIILPSRGQFWKREKLEQHCKRVYYALDREWDIRDRISEMVEDQIKISRIAHRLNIKYSTVYRFLCGGGTSPENLYAMIDLIALYDSGESI